VKKGTIMATSKDEVGYAAAVLERPEKVGVANMVKKAAGSVWVNSCP
jgi:hypothetical protein